MAKIVTLKDHKTNELAYPQTVSDAVYMDNGSTLEQYKESVSRQFANYPNVTVTGTVTNLPDNEDIRETESHTLQFADRNNLEGMGYVILRKNKSLAEQIIYENTIYEIRYDFTLDKNITIPENCVLKFEGGSISSNNSTIRTINYHLIYIDARDNDCIFKNVTLAIYDTDSYLTNSYISVGWFKSTNATNDDEAESVKLAMSSVYYGKELRFISNKEYKISSLGRFRTVCDINLNNATIKLVGNNEDYLINYYSDSSWTAVYRHSGIRNGRIIGYEGASRSDNNVYENIIVLSNSGGYDLINFRISNIKFYRVTATNTIVQSLYCYGLKLYDVDFHYIYADSCIEFVGGRPQTGGVYYNLAGFVDNCDLSPQYTTNYGIKMSHCCVTIRGCIIEGLLQAGVYVKDVPTTSWSSKAVFTIEDCHMEVNAVDFKIEGNNNGSNITKIERCRCSDANKFIEAFPNAIIIVTDCTIMNSGGVLPSDDAEPDSNYYITSERNDFSKKSSDTHSYIDIFVSDIVSYIRRTFIATIPSGDSSQRLASTIGTMFFDTSISPARPIWWTGTTWVDATGQTV